MDRSELLEPATGEVRILLFGCEGQIGWELQRALAPLGQVVPLARVSSDELCGDLTRPDLLAATVRMVAPDVVVNAAAYTAVDEAETEPELAEAVNSLGPRHLAMLAAESNAWLIHYSTDYVFDGSGDQPWREDDPVNPCNVYGVSKLKGEEAIRDSGCKHLIFRTSWIYSARRKNFLRTVLNLLSRRGPLRIVNDQYGAPTGAELVADVTAHALRTVWQVPSKGGMYHVAAAGVTTWFEYAKYICEQVTSESSATHEIEPVTTDSFRTPARRPLNSRLSCERLKAEFQIFLPDWRIGVCRALAELDVDRWRTCNGSNAT